MATDGAPDAPGEEPETMKPPAIENWTVEDSIENYSVERWGAGYFSANAAGHVVVRPDNGHAGEIDLHDLMEDLRGQGLRSPILLRFSDILKARIRTLAETFAEAIADHGYAGRFRGVFPIKVNQQRHVVEEIVRYGADHGIGLEAGSKPELLIALALLDDPDRLVICNGFKDRAYIETALLSQGLGRRPVIVIDRYSELPLLIETARELGVTPHIGLRARLSARGSGRWFESSGRRSKFGLSPEEIVRAVELLRSEEMLDSLELLHCHIGSQISTIRTHKEALREVCQIYVGLHQIGAKSLTLLDVGGGLGVDYGVDDPENNTSIDYSTIEYANDVVETVLTACDEAEVAVPDLITESGRAMVAHHSVLVFDIIGADRMASQEPLEDALPDEHRVVSSLREMRDDIDEDNVQAARHRSVELRDEAESLFSLGHLDLRSRAIADRLFHDCSQKILDTIRELEEIPAELCDLETELADTYFGNFSLFQSVPDHWALDQLFPVMPIHRLDEEPTRRAILADLTCDSDGKMDQFIGRGGAKSQLELHAMNGEPYYLAVFLVGAYQEILGDLHNLFGDTDAVHVRLDGSGRTVIDHVVDGDGVRDVLAYVQYERGVLTKQITQAIETAREEGKISAPDARRLAQRYEEGLREYTYLSDSTRR